MLTCVFDKLKEYSLEWGLWRFVDGHRVLTVLTACSAGVLLYASWFIKRPRNLPPGPYGYPILGCLPMFEQAQSGFKKITEKYGDIFTLWTGGNKYVIILNSYEAIKDVYVKSGSSFMDRDAEGLSSVFGIEDTILNSHYDDTCKESRKVAIQSFRTLITKKLGQILKKELEEMECLIELNPGQPTDVSFQTKRTLINTVTQILFSKRYNKADADSLIQKLWHWNDCSSKALFKAFLPWYLSMVLVFKEVKEGRQVTKEILAMVAEHVSHRVVTRRDEETIEDVLDAYLQSTNAETFTENKIIGTLFTFLPDASYTSSIMVQWLLLYLANHPKTQDDIFDEVKHVCGDVIDLNKRTLMPVTESFIMEVFRIVTPFGFGFFNKPLTLTTLRGYSIPPYVSIMPHISAVHKDPHLFVEPATFKPKRFIKDGQIGNTQGFMPFGIGRRMCVGEQLVRNNMFYIVTRLVLKYKITPPGGVAISTDCEGQDFVKMPKKYSLCFETR